MDCCAELLKPVEIPQVQFSDKVSIESCAILGENIEMSWVTSAWRLALRMLRVSVRGRVGPDVHKTCGGAADAVLRGLDVSVTMQRLCGVDGDGAVEGFRRIFTLFSASSFRS